MFKNNQSGQIALVILLIMVVILTIGLSLAARSITDIRISQDEKEAVRAFSAAEAGIEEALRQDLSIWSGGVVSVGVGVSANVTVAETGEGTTQTIEKGETMTVNLTGAGATQLTINWIDSTKTEETSDKASIEIVIYAGNSTFSRYAYNARGTGTGFDFTDSNQGTGGFDSSATITLTAQDVLARIKPLYNKATIKINSDGLLLTQQYNIDSVVEVERDKVGKMVVSRTIPILPSIFDYVLFSGGNLSN